MATAPVMKLNRIAPGYYKASYKGVDVEVFGIPNQKETAWEFWGWNALGGRFDTRGVNGLEAQQTHQDMLFTKADAMADVQHFIDTASFHEVYGWLPGAKS